MYSFLILYMIDYLKYLSFSKSICAFLSVSGCRVLTFLNKHKICAELAWVKQRYIDWRSSKKKHIKHFIDIGNSTFLHLVYSCLCQRKIHTRLDSTVFSLERLYPLSPVEVSKSLTKIQKDFGSEEIFGQNKLWVKKKVFQI